MSCPHCARFSFGARRPASKAAAMRSARRHVRGVTALELLVTVAVIGILLAVAVPSFADLIRRNRVATEINAFVGDLQFARAEAIRRGERVVICAANAAGTQCASAGTPWNTGWIIFNDTDEDGTLDTGETLVRKQAAWPGTDAFTASNNVAIISYSRDGFAVGLPAASVTLTLRTNPVDAQATRCVTVNLAGRQQVLTAGGTCT
jgi:type IV fimbrial biogenesis protein FimT